MAFHHRTWFGFDLDDTLHEFRKASGSASLAVFEEIHTEHGVDINSLRESYSLILRNMTAKAFADGKTSTDYRKERFAALLVAHSLTYDDNPDYPAKLAEVYKSALQKALIRKPGALELLQTLKRAGKKIIVITEGPKDAQEWTLAQLGLAPYVDVIVTTNEIGKSKVDGLFEEVLRRYAIKSQEVVYIGDNKERDILPAAKAGILTILYDENVEYQLEIGNGNGTEELRTDSLTRIEKLL